MLTKEEETFKARLTELKDFLMTKVPTGKFRFTSWVGLDWKGMTDLSCGASACAFGWATTIKTFQDLGLGLFRTDGGFVTVAMSKEAVVENSSTAAQKAGEELFGLSLQEFNYLFIPREAFDNEDDIDESFLSEELLWQKEKFGRFGCPHSATAKDVAENIEHFIAVKYGE